MKIFFHVTFVVLAVTLGSLAKGDLNDSMSGLKIILFITAGTFLYILQYLLIEDSLLNEINKRDNDKQIQDVFELKQSLTKIDEKIMKLIELFFSDEEREKPFRETGERADRESRERFLELESYST